MGDDDEVEIHDNVCHTCTLPCRDADADQSRMNNCVRCQPCFLCDYCKVELPSHHDGGSMVWVCLWCLRRQEVTELREDMRFRHDILCMLSEEEDDLSEEEDGELD